MSVKAVNWAKTVKGTTPGQKLILMLLAEAHNGKTGKCFPTIARLGDESSYSKRQVIRILKQLEDGGLICSTHSRGRKKANDYKLNTERKSLNQLPVIYPIKGDTRDTFFKKEKVTFEKEKVTSMTIKGDIHVTPIGTIGSTLSEIMSFSGKNNTDCRAAIDYLNQTAGRSFRHSKTNLGLTLERLREGMTLQDLMTVVDHKVSEWGRNPRMSGYLRPQTLFGTKAEAYLEAAKAGAASSTSNYNLKAYGEFINGGK